MKYSEKEMASLISEVERQFADYLAKAEEKQGEKLEKSETIQDTQEEIVNETEETVEEQADESQELEKTEEPQEFDYNEEDFIMMDNTYRSMSKAEQEVHFQSLKKVIFGEEVEKTEEVVEKTEEITEKVEEVVEKTEEIKKEEDILEKKEFDMLKQENLELKKNLEQITLAFTKYIEKTPPKRKAITKLEYIKKSEDLSEDQIDVANLSQVEISKKLSEKIKTGSLTKSDRDAINNYYLSETKSIDSIKHLL